MEINIDALVDKHYYCYEELGMSIEDFRSALLECERLTREECAKESNRYRFLRQWFSPMGVNISGNHAWTWRGSPANLRGPNLDEAVDAAIRGMK